METKDNKTEVESSEPYGCMAQYQCLLIWFIVGLSL